MICQGMRHKLKVGYTDMWGHAEYQFHPENNYFYKLLSLRYDVTWDQEAPDLIIFSCFGDRHLNYSCKKLFFTGENIKQAVPGSERMTIKPDYNLCDASISHFADTEKNKYFPLWCLFVNWMNMENPLPLPSNPTFIIEPELLIAHESDDLKEMYLTKKFCAFMNNNPVPDRIELFERLNSILRVDSYGKLFNNVGGPIRGSEEVKQSILNEHRFTIAYENSITLGYNTEKIIQPYAAKCIPIYSGGLDKTIFSSDSMFYVDEYNSTDEMVEEIIDTNNDYEKWHNKVTKPLFIGNKLPDRFMPMTMLNWISESLQLA